MARSPVERKARNEALFREVNERIEKVVEDAANPEFLCECADEDCCETLELSIAEYEAIRRSPVRFPVKPGHSDPEVERVVEEHEQYVVAEKRGRAAEIVRERDPRSQS